MITQLRWEPARLASALYGAQLWSTGRRLVDPQLAASLRHGVQQLLAVLAQAGIPQELFFLHAIPLGAGQVSLREWASVSLHKAGGRQAADCWLSEVQEAVRWLVAVQDQRHPDGAQELALRAGPVREQWEARGPGLLAALARQTNPGLVPPHADVLLVQPVGGGGGRAHLLYNSVSFEAVLTNPCPSLPETLRLAWLVGQLQLELPEFQGRLGRTRLMELAEHALVPAVLSAAEEVELAFCGAETVAMALAAWHVLPRDVSPERAADAAEQLLNWWGTYVDRRPAFSVALAALDQMLLPTGAVPGDR